MHNNKTLHIITYRFTILCSCIVFLFLLATSMSARQISSNLEHFPVTVAREGQAIDVKVRITSRSSPIYVRVYYKTLSEQNFRFSNLESGLNEYQGQIPADFVKSPIVQYFILVLYANQSIETLPALNPYGQPFEIIVEESKSKILPKEPVTTQPPSPNVPRQAESQPASSSGVTAIILSPEPLKEVNEYEVVIAVGFNQQGGNVDVSSIRLEVDGNDYTSAAEISEFMVMLSPKHVTSGSHRVTLSAHDANGNQIPSLAWRFLVGSGTTGDDLPVRRNYTGRVYTEFRQEKFSNQKLNANNAGGNLSGQFGPFNLNALAYFTALEDSRLQPRNRFSLNINSKMLEFGVGDLYPYYNELILWGRRIRGVHSAVKLGFINFQYATGQSVRNIAAIRDPVTNSVLSSGTFGQKLNAGRLSFGRGNNFQLGLMVLKVRDDNDTTKVKLDERSVTPKDNLVTGADILIRLHSGRIELKGSVAASLLTQDITNGPATRKGIADALDIDTTDIPIDPKDLEKWFILNESTTPLDPTGGTSVAYLASMRLNYFRNFLQFGIKKFGREYVSLGQSYLRNNISGFYVNDRINLFQNKVYMNLGLDSYIDNFSEDDGNPKTNLTTFNYGLSFYISPHYPMVSFGLRNYVRDNNIERFIAEQLQLGVSDTTGMLNLREETISRDLNFNLAYNFNLSDIKNTLNISLINSKLIDEVTRSTLSASRDFANFIQSVALKTQFSHPLVTVISFATNKNESTKKLNEIDFTMFAGRAEYSFGQKKLTLYAGFRSVVSSGLRKVENQVDPVAVVDYKQLGFQFGLYYVFRKKHRFVVDTDFINFKDSGKTQTSTIGTSPVVYTGNPSFNNSLIRLYYEFRI